MIFLQTPPATKPVAIVPVALFFFFFGVSGCYSMTEGTLDDTDNDQWFLEFFDDTPGSDSDSASDHRFDSNDSDSVHFNDTDSPSDTAPNIKLDPDSTCSIGKARLQECGIISKGTANCVGLGLDIFCIEDCFLETECYDLELLYCDESAPLSQALSTCVGWCLNDPANYHDCSDGSKTIPISWECDLEADCANGEDEVNCNGNSGFECPGENSIIPNYWVCDEIVDCYTGADEENCATFSCF